MTTREILREAQRARWQWLRQLGFWKYVLRFGVIGWGLPMFVVMTFFVNSHGDRLGDRLRSVWWIVFSAVLWGLAGLWFGWMTWKSSERKFSDNATGENTRPV